MQINGTQNLAGITKIKNQNDVQSLKSQKFLPEKLSNNHHSHRQINSTSSINSIPSSNATNNITNNHVNNIRPQRKSMDVHSKLML